MRRALFALALGACGPSEMLPPNIKPLCETALSCGATEDLEACAACLEDKTEAINASGEKLETCESLKAALRLCE